MYLGRLCAVLDVLFFLLFPQWWLLYCISACVSKFYALGLLFGFLMEQFFSLTISLMPCIAFLLQQRLCLQVLQAICSETFIGFSINMFAIGGP